MADNDKKYVPQLRFPEFVNDGEWNITAVADVIHTIVPSKKLKSSEYKNEGEFPIIDQSQNYIAGYSDDSSALLNTDNKTGVIFGDHTCSLKSVDFPFIQGADGIKIFYSDEDLILTRYLYQYLLAHPLNVKEYKRHFSELREIKVIYPKNISEQRKIADCLSSFDGYIDATKKKLEQLKEHKTGLMQKLFPAKGKTVPEIRFPEFRDDGEWNEVSLGDITTAVNRRNKSKRALPVYSINNINGFVPQTEQFDRIDSASRGYDTSAYKIIGKHTFAYNPARINVGSIGYSGELTDILISSLYVSFKSSDIIYDEFLMCFFNSYLFRQAVECNVEGGIRSYLFYENFARIKIMIPPIAEQKKIATYFSSVNELINLLSAKISLLERTKIGLQQKFFKM